MGELVKKVMPCSEDEVCEIRKIYGKSEEDIRCDLDILKEWLRKQPHLPQDIEDAVLERFLLRNKFRMEIAKQKLDLHFTAKGMHKDYLLQADPTSELMKTVYSTVIWPYLPVLGKERERITIAKFVGNPDLYQFEKGALIGFFAFELQLRHDYCSGVRLIVDFDGFTWSQFKTVTPSNFSRAMFLLQEAYCARIVGLDMLNPPYFMEFILQMCKMVLKPKIFSRIVVHRDLESLHKCVPKHCLPKEYGGDLDSMYSLFEDTKKLWIEERDMIVNALRTTSNEDLRIGDKYAYREIFGVDGTFRKIQVD